MRTITFHKHDTAICLFCKKNRVPQNRWNTRCDDCRKKQKDVDKVDRGIAKAQPAAVIVDDNGNRIFVDKLGKKVENPGYDLDNDPRGWKFTGAEKPKRTIIK